MVVSLGEELEGRLSLTLENSDQTTSVWISFFHVFLFITCTELSRIHDSVGGDDNCF
jgi:hypothetical protein